MATKKKTFRKRRRKSIFGRVILGLLIGGIAAGGAFVFVRPLLLSTRTTARAVESTLGNTYTGTLVIARDEKLTETESNTSIDFVALEGSHLNRSDVICKVYSSGYNQTEINRLRNYREQIQVYHNNQVFSSYVDAALDSENAEIAELARQVRTLVRGKGVGSLPSLERQLTSALTSRKNYLKAKYPDDQSLAELYKIENDQLKKIESWTTTYSATEDCLVSFYTDGYENSVNASTYAALSPSDVRNVIRGILPEQTVVSRGNKPIFRRVIDGEWFALFLCQDKDWNPVVGQTYQLQLGGFEDYQVSGQVDSFSRIGNDLLLRMRVSQPVDEVLNIRTCEASVGDFVSGFYVPIKALYAYDNSIGVVVVDGNGRTFVAVTVVSYPDSETAFVRPMLPGSPLMDKKTVLLFN